MAGASAQQCALPELTRARHRDGQVEEKTANGRSPSCSGISVVTAQKKSFLSNGCSMEVHKQCRVYSI